MIKDASRTAFIKVYTLPKELSCYKSKLSLNLQPFLALILSMFALWFILLITYFDVIFESIFWLLVGILMSKMSIKLK